MTGDYENHCHAGRYDAGDSDDVGDLRTSDMTCLVCLSAKVASNKLDTVRGMERIGKTVMLHTADDERCRACGSTLGPVYWLTRVEAGI